MGAFGCHDNLPPNLMKPSPDPMDATQLYLTKTGKEVFSDILRFVMKVNVYGECFGAEGHITPK